MNINHRIENKNVTEARFCRVPLKANKYYNNYCSYSKENDENKKQKYFYRHNFISLLFTFDITCFTNRKRNSNKCLPSSDFNKH